MKHATPTLENSGTQHLPDEVDLVDCFLTGKKIPKKDARLVRIGPGSKVWLPKDCCRPG